MSTSELSITKRRLLGGIAIAAVGFALTACSGAAFPVFSRLAQAAISRRILRSASCNTP